MRSVPAGIVFITIGLLSAAGGCAAQQPKALAATQPSPATARVDYWLRRPATTHVEAAEFERLWRSSQDVARAFGFRLDREDFRGGVITTVPLVSKQWFELWRRDVATLDDLAESSLATYRRTLRFDIEKTPDGRYVAVPRVVIERYSLAERPITASANLSNAFRTDRRRRPTGTRETDRGVYLPRQYWYATGRDVALEQDVAQALQKRLGKT